MSGDVFNRYKEQVKMAMKFSKIEIDEDANGPVYETVTKDEAVSEVLKILDEMYYQLDQALSSGRAVEKLIHKYNPNLDEQQFLRDYMEAVAEERLKDNGYIYEDDKTSEEMRDERRKLFTVIEGGKRDE